MKKIALTIILLLVPTFGLMLRGGIFTMHDPTLFRQYEFNNCVQQLIFPCRWAPDAGMGYGEPVFNYYGQFPYWIGQLFISTGISILDATKISFILSLLVSALSMYLLAREIWGKTGGLISAIFYSYASYRAVDVWVRGNLSETWAFVFFPLILLFIKRFIEISKSKYLFWLILSISGLVITHNLSLLMMFPFAIAWTAFWWWKSPRSVHAIYDLTSAGLVSVLLSAFYLWPVIFESSLVTLGQTIAGYYDFHLHYATLKQLFLSTFWGYGGSGWGPIDGLSFAVGHVHWVIVGVVIVFAIYKYLTPNPSQNTTTLSQRYPHFISPYLGGETPQGEGVLKNIIFFSSLGLLAIFLTHGKSDFIWNLVKPMAYIQFPWRFLTMSTLFLSLSAGAVYKFIPKILVSLLLCLLLLLNSGVFRPDIWRDITDAQQFSGKLWDEQRSSSLSDYWPKSAPILPNKFAPTTPEIILETDTYQKIRYPIVYFPGWTARNNKQELFVYPSGELGLVTVRAPANSNIKLSFEDTPVRKIGNIVSLITLFGLVIWIWKKS